MVSRAPEINRKTRGREQLDCGRIFAHSGRGRKGRIRAQAAADGGDGFARSRRGQTDSRAPLN
jgi:hypothetical protein